jgi:hypothetical protein
MKDDESKSKHIKSKAKEKLRSLLASIKISDKNAF